MYHQVQKSVRTNMLTTIPICMEATVVISESKPCTHAWDMTLGHDIVHSIFILSQLCGDRKFKICLNMREPRWLNFSTICGRYFACPRFAAQTRKSGSLGQAIIFNALSHYLVKKRRKTSYKNTIRHSV